eukprot:TRINITY_DN6617_c0_g1_i1.p1 TRINITY_DN6617_c0_g1~~TRINITY_DN6617_c0_g1_i1.p1  ORF type:complete len:159 (-),score=25.80 TRINITY_DN6617_c0_g1_i1:51-482(-)
MCIRDRASKKCGVHLSTAQGIIRIYKEQGRIGKKKTRAKRRLQKPLELSSVEKLFLAFGSNLSLLPQNQYCLPTEISSSHCDGIAYPASFGHYSNQIVASPEQMAFMPNFGTLQTYINKGASVEQYSSIPCDGDYRFQVSKLF